jgi:hypothetical protein
VEIIESLDFFGLLPRRRGRPSTGKAMTSAERQRVSRLNRKKERFDTFQPKSVTFLLSARAVKALEMLSHNSDLSQKSIVESLLIAAYEREVGEGVSS